MIPHLTVADHVEPEVLHELEPRLASSLPIETRADEAWLMVENDEGRWDLHTRFPLGPAGE